uniref:Uncharacterized protein n=1 Tax=viral metagenome TaxID=1070528 RepID=A0A6M3JHX0_9ZZZZ
MLREIRSEIIEVMCLCIIISCGVMMVDFANRRAVWDETYQNWEYNIYCDVPDGYSRAACGGK